MKILMTLWKTQNKRFLISCPNASYTLLHHLHVPQTVQTWVWAASLQLIDFSSEEVKRLAKGPAHLLSIDKEGFDLFTCETEAFIMEVYDHFSVSSKCAGALNEISDFMEMEGDNLFRHVSTKWLLLLPAIEKMLKYWFAFIFKV